MFTTVEICMCVIVTLSDLIRLQGNCPYTLITISLAFFLSTRLFNSIASNLLVYIKQHTHYPLFDCPFICFLVCCNAMKVPDHQNYTALL